MNHEDYLQENVKYLVEQNNKMRDCLATLERVLYFEDEHTKYVSRDYIREIIQTGLHG